MENVFESLLREILFQQTLSNLKQHPMAVVILSSLKWLRLKCTLTQVGVCIDFVTVKHQAEARAVWVTLVGTEPAARDCKGPVVTQEHCVRFMCVVFVLNLDTWSGWHCHFKCVCMCVNFS